MKKRTVFLLLCDSGIFFVVYMMLAVLNFWGGVENFDFSSFLWQGLILLAVLFGIRALFRCYANVWRYANSQAYLYLTFSDACAGLLSLIFLYVFQKEDFFAQGIWEILTLYALVNLATVSSRMVYQQLYRITNTNNENDRSRNRINVAIVGAGQVGSLLAEQMLFNSDSHYKPIFFIDLDKEKIGNTVCGLKVYHENEAVLDLLASTPIQEVFIALPKIDGDTAKEKQEFFSRAGCKVKFYNADSEDALGAKSSVTPDAKLREVKIEDLLFRNSLAVNNPDVLSYYTGKIVLVTGGGGSIGSEICRQIAKQNPRKLIILDIYENNAYEIQQELIREYGYHLDLNVEIASVRDRARLDAVFAHYRPDVVFHAAAHKHVPLMEHSNAEAIKNNINGTNNAADMAEKYGVKKFILISTDKAVNPTNVMGASKRMCEMVVQCRADSKTCFAAVRFGNVLGSNGSVIPLFRKQIEEGGPVTITDKRIIRYFMTIPEAAQLVMQAGAMAKSGELFVLDMGKPVKILELAENMIRLSGFRPYRDIAIREVGLRPGEKLYEELLIKTENLQKTENNLIFIEHDTPFSREEIARRLALLNAAVIDNSTEIEAVGIKEALKAAVPTFRDPEEVNRNALDAEEMKMVSDKDGDGESDGEPAGAVTSVV